MATGKKFLEAILDEGLTQEFVEFLLRQKSIVINDYAKVFCRLKKVKCSTRTDDEHDKRLKDIIRIAKTPWLDKDL